MHASAGNWPGYGTNIGPEKTAVVADSEGAVGGDPGIPAARIRDDISEIFLQCHGSESARILCLSRVSGLPNVDMSNLV